MLGDQTAEKSKPTFKTAIRRRKKTVTFAAPTYVDYEDFDYSSDDEDQEEIFAQQQMAARQAREQQQQQQVTASSAEIEEVEIDSESEIEDETAKVEPLKPRVVKETVKTPEPAKTTSTDDSHMKRASEEMFDGKSDGVSRSRNGTVRNTDSFFKDDTVETKKITLTPNLLRDDNTPRDSTESKELRPRPSLDKVLDKDKDDKKKRDKDKKDKDKKPSVIRNFFSRKDKKKGGADDYDDDPKKSMDGNEPRDSKEQEEVEGGDGWTDKSAAGPQRHPSKLQKQQPRTEPSPTRGKGPTAQKPADIGAYISETRNDVSNVPPATMRIVDSETQETKKVSSQPTKEELSRTNGSSQESTNVENGTSTAQETERGPRAQPQQPNDRQTDSPVRSSPTSASRPPPLMVDTSSQEDHSASPSPELVDIDTEGSTTLRKQDSVTTNSTSTAESTATWNDAKLRAFFETGTDIRDMLVVVYDKTDVAPAGPDHPLVGSLFREQNAKLAEITTVSIAPETRDASRRWCYQFINSRIAT